RSLIPPCATQKREKVDDFYAARSRTIPPLPWSSFPPPFSLAAQGGLLLRRPMADFCSAVDSLAVLLARDLVLLLPRLHRVPEIVIEDAQLRRFLDDPFLFRVGAGLPLAGVRILDEALPVPDDLADIHLVVEDAVAALRVAVDRAETPVAARRSGNAFLVQGEGDGLGRFAGGIVAEDAAHDFGL